MNNYESALRRINKAKTIKELQKVETGISRVHDAGFFTDHQFMRLDENIVDQYIRFEGVKA